MERKFIEFKIIFDKKKHKVKWPWQDYMALVYVLNNTDEAKLFNSGNYKLVFQDECKIKLSVGSKKPFEDVELDIRTEISYQTAIEFDEFPAESYPNLCKRICKSNIYNNDALVYAEQHGNTIFVVYNKSVTEEVKHIVDKSHGLYASRSSGNAAAAGSTGSLSLHGTQDQDEDAGTSEYSGTHGSTSMRSGSSSLGASRRETGGSRQATGESRRETERNSFETGNSWQKTGSSSMEKGKSRLEINGKKEEISRS